MIECTIPSIKDVENVAKEILRAEAGWWLRSPSHFSNCVMRVNSSGNIGSDGSFIYLNYAVRPILITNLKSLNLKVGCVCKILGISWVYIGDGKFLTKDVEFYSIFDKESNDYETSFLKKSVNKWFSKLKYMLPSRLNTEKNKNSYIVRFKDKDDKANQNKDGIFCFRNEEYIRFKR